MTINGQPVREFLGAYIDAFNRSDYAALTDYYDDDVELVIGNGTVMRGKQAIVDFYSVVKSQTSRTIKILHCMEQDGVIAAEFESEFLALEDAPDFTSGPLAKGDRLYINSFAFYELGGGKFTRIRAAVFKRVWKRVGEDPA
ncbi:nuclear transport factor 2 family protein [Parasphingopyxis marina]|uniref:Nuclear transport factor 2 family protein n=1 Tax=Parasphingopyxis marina TaxID=2761622 RepID=A0A842HWI6_9SPHN|nr:nuclear transport factor 2 family protein [Parasphingopyxis marina]MBC2776777.1 nuclear transport factor 2 family protein [Parasphingopyxis marina]